MRPWMMTLTLVFFVLSADYADFSDIRQQVIFDVVRAFAAEEIALSWQPAGLVAPRT